MAVEEPLFPGFFVGGFECSSHRLASGRRLDLAQSTRHLEFADADYARLREFGLRVARDGIAWHRVEPRPFAYDFGSVLPLVRAARRAGVRVVWDLMHFGWPDDLDVFVPAFVERFAALATAFGRMLADESDDAAWICPVNEISFLAWAGGDVGFFNPFAHARGFELKCQLVRASIAAIDALRAIDRRTRIVVHDPAFNVVAAHDRPQDAEAAEASRQLQFQACDLLSGRAWPQLGGRADHLDVIGVNYYPWNQWTFGTALHPGSPIGRDHPGHRPLRDLLAEWHDRYGRPVYVGETGCEGEGRAAWFRTACDEVVAARDGGARIEGLCLYPVVNFPGWENDRRCENGLWEEADASGHRAAHEPLADELARQQARIAGIVDPRSVARAGALAALDPRCLAVSPVGA